VKPNPEVSGWYDRPLIRDGNKVVIPNGAWPNQVELSIVATKTSGVDRFDTLQGREMILEKDGKSYFYDLTCEAKVVDQASIVVNNTAHCPNP